MGKTKMKVRHFTIIVTMLLFTATINMAAMQKTNDNIPNQISRSEADWWPMFHHDPSNTGYSTDLAVEIPSIIWNVHLGPTGGEPNEGWSSPAVVDEKVYVSGTDFFYCLYTNGTILWNYSLPGNLKSSPAVANGYVYFGHGATFYCLDADPYDDGVDEGIDDPPDAIYDVIWTTAPGGLFTTKGPAVFNDKVYVSASNKVYCVDAFTGDEIWTFILPQGYVFSDNIAVSDEKVYTTGSNWLYCLDAEGNGDGTTDLIWDAEVSGNIYSSPCVSDDRVYIGTYENIMYCFDAEFGGDPLWNTPVDGAIKSSPAIAYDTVFCGGGTSLYAFDITTGNLSWEADIQTYPYAASPAIADNKVYICAHSNLYSFHVQDGTPIFDPQSIGGQAKTTPAIVDGRLYVYSGKLNCLRDNSPPDTPSPPVGPVIGGVNRSYTFTVDGVDDPDGDKVYYQFNWGDEQTSGWLGPFESGVDMVNASHEWTTTGDMEITVSVKDEFDFPGNESESSIIEIIPYETQINSISGGWAGFGKGGKVDIELINSGELVLYEVNWSVHVTGGIFNGVNVSTSGVIDTFNPTDIETITVDGIYGLGSISITIIAEIPEQEQPILTKEQEGTVIFCIVRITPNTFSIFPSTLFDNQYIENKDRSEFK